MTRRLRVNQTLPAFTHPSECMKRTLGAWQPVRHSAAQSHGSNAPGWIRFPTLTHTLTRALSLAFALICSLPLSETVLVNALEAAGR